MRAGMNEQLLSIADVDPIAPSLRGAVLVLVEVQRRGVSGSFRSVPVSLRLRRRCVGAVDDDVARWGSCAGHSS